MANSFSSKKIQKDRFFVCISLRKDQGSMDRDIQKTKCLIEAIGKNGFKIKWRSTQNDDFACDKGIVTKDNEFQYPRDALEFVKNLNIECSKYKIQKKNCQSDCQNYLSRCPILKAGHIRYQVIMFERVG